MLLLDAKNLGGKLLDGDVRRKAAIGGTPQQTQSRVGGGGGRGGGAAHSVGGRAQVFGHWGL